MPEILIDISRLFYTRLANRIPAGIDRVSLEYVRHYGHRARAVFTLGPFSSILSPADSARAFRLLLERDRNPWLMGLWLILKGHLRWWLGSDPRNGVLFNTSNVWRKNLLYAGSLVRKGARPVFFVHDVLPITHGELFPPDEDRRHEERMETTLAAGRGIIVNSRDTLLALQDYARARRVDLPPTTVALLGQNLVRHSPGPRPLAQPYFVMLGTIEPRKNHWFVLQLWRRLIDKLGDAAPRIVVIGQRGWECENVVDLLERSRKLRGFVIERSRCPDYELVTWLHHSRALLFPSFAEGYGMPLNEALSLGVPVIASDLPVFREIAGGVPDYADSLHGPRWLSLIEDYLAPDSPLRQAQLARMKDYRPVTWDEHFSIVDEFVTELVRQQ